ncbi:MAG TPA: YciI family protein [Nitrolancea sp.]|nr:YciI family protein [Nitrolancea sp.]
MKYAAFIRYGNSDQIATVRPRHREYLGSLKEQGKLAASGPFTDDSGALIQADPFRQAGVFQEIELKEWRQVF